MKRFAQSMLALAVGMCLASSAAVVKGDTPVTTAAFRPAVAQVDATPVRWYRPYYAGTYGYGYRPYYSGYYSSGYRPYYAGYYGYGYRPYSAGYYGYGYAYPRAYSYGGYGYRYPTYYGGYYGRPWGRFY